MPKLLPHLVVVAVLLLLASPARALDRTCPRGQVWNRSVGACVAKPKVKRQSPEDKYFQALDIVNRLGDAGATATLDDAIALLTAACDAEHAPACNALGFVRAIQDGNTMANTAAMSLYQRACTLGDLDGCLNLADLHVRSLDHAGAMPIWRTACDGGSGRACYYAAERLVDGTLGAPAPDAAAPLFARALALLTPDCPRSSRSCFVLGLQHARGQGTPQDFAAAFRAFDQGCDGGSGDACLRVAIAHDYGQGTRQDKARAIAAYDRTCREFDNASACHDLALTILETPDPDHARVAAAARRGCDLDAQLCGLVGQFLATGVGGPVDQVGATTQWSRACEAGRAKACLELGDRLRDGVGATTDLGAAAVAYERACRGTEAAGCGRAAQALGDGARAFTLASRGCERDDPASCHTAAGLLYEGKDGGVRPDRRRALAYFDAGCAVGWPVSCDMAGDMRRDGTGVAVDKPGAVAKYLAGCEGTGDLLSATACESLGRMTAVGDGTDRDLDLAARAHARACLYEVDASCDEVTRLIEREPDAGARTARARELGEACDRGVAAGCVALGNVEASGALGAVDAAAAIGRWRDACAAGHAAGCLRVADAYFEGIGVVAAIDEAARRYQQLCDRGLIAACGRLGQARAREGKLDVAAALYQRGCDGDDADACDRLGAARYASRGLPWDVTGAATAFQRACDLGAASGCAHVAAMYEHGIGVHQDDTDAAHRHLGRMHRRRQRRPYWARLAARPRRWRARRRSRPRRRGVRPRMRRWRRDGLPRAGRSPS
ncbi:MAG: hypothetical protein R2939_13795 [Kofleriaceae bacterium]